MRDANEPAPAEGRNPREPDDAGHGGANCGPSKQRGVSVPLVEHGHGARDEGAQMNDLASQA